MNRLPVEKQVLVLNALVEGNSIRSIERMTGVHRDTIMRLMCRAGRACETVMDETMRGLPCKTIQVDEVWTFVGKKQARLSADETRGRRDLGDQYIFVALDADTKLVPSFIVGKRDLTTARTLLCDLESRLANRVQLTADGFGPYIPAVEAAFATEVDFAQLVKWYSAQAAGRGRYTPPRVSKIEAEPVVGNPDPSKISTSYVERQNLTMRMQMRRLTRLTNAFSKKLTNLRAAVALHFFWYNFGRVHQSLRVTPAMEAGVADRPWTMRDLLDCASSGAAY
jgi:IS1 family transposase